MQQGQIELEEIGIIEKSFTKATILYEKRKNEERISTGSKNLDDLFGGGIETRAITEIYGEYAQGRPNYVTPYALLSIWTNRRGFEGWGIVY